MELDNIDGSINSITVRGNYLFMSENQDGVSMYGVSIYDISDVENPVKVGNYCNEDGREYYGIDVEGEILYIADENGMSTVNISDVTHPKLISVKTLTIVRDVFVGESVVVVPRGSQGFQILDKTTPFGLLYNVNPPGMPYSFFFKGDFLFVADGSHGFSVYDSISTPSLASEVANHASSDARDVHVTMDDIAVVSDIEDGILFYDVTDPNNPVYLSALLPSKLGREFERISVRDEDHLCFVTLGLYGMNIINFTDPVNPTFVYQLGENVADDSLGERGVGIGSYLCGLFHGEDSYLYLADYNFGINILEVGSNPQVPIRLGSMDSNYQSFSIRVFVSEDIAYVADYTQGLALIDVSDKNEPVLLSGLLLDKTYDVHVVGNFAFVADYEGGFKIINCTDKFNPELHSSIPQALSGDVRAVYAKDEFVYIGALHDLKIANISDLSNPTIIGSIELFQCYDVFVRDNIAFLSDYTDGLKIVDVSDPTNPTLISSVDTSCEWSTFVQGNLAFIADGIGGVKIVDFSNIEFPQIIQEIPVNDAQYVVVVDNHLYVADSVRGLKSIYLELEMVGSYSAYAHFCGQTEVTVTAKDKTGEIEQTIQIVREDFCNGRGSCLPGRVCGCFDGYFGDFCGQYKCQSVNFDDFSNVCSGHGNCISPEKCDCEGSYSGDECATNVLIPALVIPSTTIFGVGVVVMVCMGVCFVCCLFCMGIACLVACLCISGFVILKQMKGLKRFSKLRDVDLILAEQEMEDDTSIAHLRINRSLFEIDFDEIKTESILGEGGSNSVVFKAKWRGKIVAFKCFRTRTILSKQDTFNEFESEVELLSSLAHPYIIRFFGATMKPPRVGIIMEYCSKGEIMEFLLSFEEKSSQRYPLFQKFRMILQICSSFEFLHSRNIIHRDLKSENVLIDEKEDTKLMDFGLSRIVENMNIAKTIRVGTSVYMAPELITDEKYSEKCDVFSFAILLWILITQDQSPYEDPNQVELKVANNPEYRPDLKKLDLALSDDEEIKNWVIDILIRCWHHDPTERYSFGELRKMFESKVEGGIIQQQVHEEEDSADVKKQIISTGKKSLKVENQKDILFKEKYIGACNEIENLKKELEDARLVIEGLKKEE